MKKFKTLLLLTAAVALGCNTSYALNAAEKGARNQVVTYLTTQGFNPKIDKEERVTFKQRNVNYWITIKSDDGDMIYTINRLHINPSPKTDDPVLKGINEEYALYAANVLNAAHPYKVDVTDGKVNFSLPVFASTPEEFINVLGSAVTSMYDISDDFNREFHAAKPIVDEMHNYWKTGDPNLVVLKQETLGAGKKDKAEIKVSAVDFISYETRKRENMLWCDKDGQLTEDKARFLGEKITLTADKAGTYYIGVEITGPDGKKIVPDVNSAFTTVTVVDVKKANKPETIDLELFGTAKGDFWKEGTYHCKIYDSNCLVRDVPFVIIK